MLFLPQQAYSLGIVAVPDYSSIHVYIFSSCAHSDPGKKGTRKDSCDSMLKMNQSLSDRPTEIKWIQLFEEKLEEISRDYTNLSRAEQEQMARVYAFFLHGSLACQQSWRNCFWRIVKVLHFCILSRALLPCAKFPFHPQSSWGIMLFVPCSDFCMPCCGVLYAENAGYRVVSCSRCARWFHVRSLGKCKGYSKMLHCSDEPLSAFLCSGCSA